MFLNWLRRLFPPPDAMSASWLKAQEKSDAARIEYHGPSLRLPIDKQRNETAWRQTRILRKKVG